MNEKNVNQLFEGTTTYIDIQSSPLLESLLTKLPLTLVNDKSKTYCINATPNVVLNALKTCGCKVIAASSTAMGTQYMWTLHG